MIIYTYAYFRVCEMSDNNVTRSGRKKLGLCCQHKVYLGTSIVAFVSRHGLDVKEECEFNGNKTRHAINTLRNEKDENTKRAIETTEGRFEKHLSGRICTRLWVRYGRRCSLANINLQKN